MALHNFNISKKLDTSMRLNDEFKDLSE